MLRRKREKEEEEGAGGRKKIEKLCFQASSNNKLKTSEARFRAETCVVAS